MQHCWRKIGSGGIVGAEPVHGAYVVRQPGAALSHEPETGLLGGNGPLVAVALAVHLEIHRPPAVRAGISSGSYVEPHIHRGALEMVSHRVCDVLETYLAGRLHEERKALRGVVAHCIFNIVHCRAGHFLAVFIDEGEIAVAEATNAATDTDIYIVRNGFVHIPFPGDNIMIGQKDFKTKAKGVTVSAVEATTDATAGDVWKVTLSAALGTLKAGDVLVEAASAGDSVLPMVTNPNCFAPNDNDFPYYDAGGDKYHKPRTNINF